MKRGGMWWPFESSTSTPTSRPTTSSSSWLDSSSWNPFSSRPSSSSYGSYGSSPAQPIQPSTYPSVAPDQYQGDQGQTGYNQDYNQGYNQQYAGYRRKRQRQTKKALLITYPDLRPSLNRTGGKTRKMSRRRKH